MKILICYHSETGNTEAVAKSMAEGLADQEVVLLAASKVDPASLCSYDVVFLGTGIYGGAIGKTLKNLMSQCTELPPKFVLFCTHANPDPAIYRGAFKKIEKQLTDKSCQICAQFQCIGENRNQQIVDMLLKTMPTMKPALEASKGHPNSQDLEKAKEFAHAIIQEL
jgi:flavodoxin